MVLSIKIINSVFLFQYIAFVKCKFVLIVFESLWVRFVFSLIQILPDKYVIEV